MTGVLPGTGVADYPALPGYDRATVVALGSRGPADLASAAARSLGRAEEATAAAVRHLVRAGEVDWTGPGAARYREDLAAALDGVRLARVRLRDAEAAAAEHAATVREREALALAAGCPPGLPSRELVPWRGTRWVP